MAVVAPNPSPRHNTATLVKPGFFRSWRKAKRIKEGARGEGLEARSEGAAERIGHLLSFFYQPLRSLCVGRSAELQLDCQDHLRIQLGERALSVGDELNEFAGSMSRVAFGKVRR